MGSDVDRMSDLPVGRILGKEGVRNRRDPVRSSIGIAGNCPAAEDRSELTQGLIHTVRFLMSVEGKRNARAIVALRKIDIRGGPEMVFERHLGEAGEALRWNRVIGEWRTASRVDDRRRETASQLVGTWNHAEEIRSTADFCGFPVHQPEGLVSPVVDLRNVDWTADDKAVLVLTQHGNTGLEETPGIESVVPVEPEQGAVQVIRSALTDEIDLIGAETVFRRVVRCLLFELLDGVH